VKKDKKSEKNEDLVKVILDVSDDTFGISGERVWANPLGNDFCDTPWHTCDVNWGDVVRAVAANEKEWPKFVEVVRRSGHRTLHIHFRDDADEAFRTAVLNRLKDWRANYENADSKFYAIDVHPEGDLDGLCAYLDQPGSSKLDYRTIVTPI
jgi:Domain of unknown function (DUF4265)